ncbi:class I SAM-dependent methyltransferase [Kitasatospora sp. NBC_01250]|uniref:class I SAM-dependent methyltransferase n=1 Tax=unclassified Kitasatospora TaxID=2633591 RepID=UPI002E0D905A|nr:MULTISPECIES: class I SAM-dependent methyltransferase [unclassified Kitasatospora]WSJ67671.1 class I SAM-dependent methyltransferase [Kitasatospora sp. NBC_01302]
METESFEQLLTEQGQRLLDDLQEYAPEQELALATRLRREHPAELVSAALGQARLRQRAGAKFGADARRMYFTPNGVEQSTRRTVADWRARRFAALGVRRLADLCGGIGGDAIALARAGISVLAVDRDPLTCAVAAANAAALGLAELIEVRCADVTEVSVDGFDAVFTDPARRTAKGRVFDPAAYSPPLSWAIEAGRRTPFGALKVAPGIPHDAVPEDAEAEWVSDHGEVKEAVLWFGTGPAADAPHRATLLPGGDSLTGGRLPDPPAGPVRRYLYEPDGAVIRAHLVAEVAGHLGATLIDPMIAYLTSDRLLATPYAHAYEITDVLPFNVKKLKALLRQRAVGTVVIKKRGIGLTPEELRRQLKPEGPNAATVFLTRIADAPAMLVAQPTAQPAGGAM